MDTSDSPSQLPEENEPLETPILEDIPSSDPLTITEEASPPLLDIHEKLLALLNAPPNPQTETPIVEAVTEYVVESIASEDPVSIQGIVEEVTSYAQGDDAASQQFREALSDSRVSEGIQAAIVTRLNSPASQGQPLHRLTFTYLRLLIKLANLDITSLIPDVQEALLEKAGLALQQNDEPYCEELCAYFGLDRQSMLTSETFQGLALQTFFRLLEQDINSPATRPQDSEIRLTLFKRRFLADAYISQISAQQEIAHLYFDLFRKSPGLAETKIALLQPVQELLNPPIPFTPELEHEFSSTFREQLPQVFEAPSKVIQYYTDFFSLFASLNATAFLAAWNAYLPPLLNEILSAFPHYQPEEQLHFLQSFEQIQESRKKLATTYAITLPNPATLVQKRVDAVVEHLLRKQPPASIESFRKLLTTFELPSEKAAVALQRIKVQDPGNLSAGLLPFIHFLEEYSGQGTRVADSRL